ncbi:hypothetical protein TruAng_007031 [Truncatella angustata]|nr:hypothetical protein TruAng_007031 [Truncatella angustata]
MISKSSYSSAPVKPTGNINTAVPTVISKAPASSTTVAADVYASNLAEALQYNTVFNNLTVESACQQGQAACVTGNIGECNAHGAFEITSCTGTTQCFALPMNTTTGVQIGCHDPAIAAKILGGSAASSTAVVSTITSSSSATSSTTSSQTPANEPTEVTVTIKPSPTTIISQITITINTSAQQTSATSAVIETPSTGSTTLSTRTRSTSSQSDRELTNSSTKRASTSNFITEKSSTTSSITRQAPTLTTLDIIPIHTTTKTKSSHRVSDVPEATTNLIPNGGAKLTAIVQSTTITGPITITVKETETATVTETTTTTEHDTTTVQS